MIKCRYESYIIILYKYIDICDENYVKDSFANLCELYQNLRGISLNFLGSAYEADQFCGSVYETIWDMQRNPELNQCSIDPYMP